MRQFFSSCILAALAVIVNMANAQTPSIESQTIPAPTVSNLIQIGKPDSCTITSHVNAYDSVNLSLEGIRLIADSGQLLHNVDFIVSTLAARHVAPLQSDMVNMTAGAYAYRLLPHGEHFSSPALLQLAYNPLTLPTGFRPEDIHTYYYNDDNRQWMQLDRYGVDTVNHVILSSTTHFTDFINAVIRTPDMPEVSAFVPTQILDMEIPNPFQHLTMIQTPQANNCGSAQIAYPIEIPSGRNGLQPDISLYYNSSNGNGILGLGWDVMQPAITIDTRWGVPRYDTIYESEIYMLNGMQCVLKDDNPDLTLPYQTNSRINRQTGSIVFIARDTRNCDRIIRHGNKPNEYWWEVVDRNGTVSYYGKYADDMSVNQNCVLRDTISGNIGYWALAEMVDISGNFIRYEYNIGSANDIYIKRIYYTGHKVNNDSIDLDPSYRVFFHYDQRADILRDGRLGFVRQTDSIICYIDLTFLANNSGDQSVCQYQNRRFIMQYNDSSTVSLLSQIQDHINFFDTRWPVTGDCSTHTYGGRDCLNGNTNFNYFNPSFSTIFADSDTIIPYPDASPTMLNVANSRTWDLGGTLSVGYGQEIWNTNLSVGGNYRFARSHDNTKQMLIDINGDGLTDLVYIKEDSIYFRPQYYEGNSPRFGEAVNTGISSKKLSYGISDTHSWGLQTGVEVYGAHANISGGMAYTTSKTKSYFADINNDGLPDFIDDGQVYFNRLQTSNGFIAHSGESEVILDSTQCVPFYYDGEVEFIPDYYVHDTIVSTYVFQTPDCSLGYHGTDPKPIPVEPWEALMNCEECDSVISLYIQSGLCPINLHLNRDMNGSSQEDDAALMPRDSMVHRGDSLEQLVIGCLKYCGAELPCEDCLEYYLMGDIDKYEQCKADKGCRTLCGPCAYHLLYGDKDGYLGCMNDTCLEGTLYTVSTPCHDCDEECIDDIYHCRECIDSNPLCMVCEECEQACANGLADCLECKRDNNCLGGYEIKCIDDCYGPYADTTQCGDCMYAYGYYCEECEDTCRLHPELCQYCVDHHCYYDQMAVYMQDCYWQAVLLLNQWKTSVQQQYDNITIIQDGNIYYAHQIDTIYPPKTDPEIEAVRVWVAPRNGTVTLQSSIQLIQDTAYSRIHARQVDGVHCVIQHHKNVTVNTNSHTLQSQSDRIIDTETIGATDYQTRQKTYSNIQVKQGDVFFFRLRSVRTHNFDNVNWEQIFTYNGDSISYSSVNDFTCSSDNLFQSPDSGSVELNTDIVCPAQATALLTILVDGNPVDSIVINSNTSHSTNEIAYSKNSMISLQLSSAYNLGQIEVRPLLSYTPHLQDSAHRPYELWIAPQVIFEREVELDSIYYNLFGSLYKGWGQFGYNNSDTTDRIPLPALVNTAVDFSRTAPVDSASFCQSIIFAESDSTRLMQEGELANEFSTHHWYDPLDNAWIQMSADISQYRYEAYGRLARNGRQLLSNTRDTKAMIETIGGTYTQEDEEAEVDSYMPVLPNGQRVTTVYKEAKTTQWNINAGLGVLSYGIGHTYSASDYTVTSDFMDMNGDGYPDIVHPSSIQYTQSWGGLGENRTVNMDAYANHSETHGNSCSGSYSYTKKTYDGFIKNGRFLAHANGSVGTSTTISDSYTAIAYMDVNSDGLPDKLIRRGDSVSACLNIGYGFAAPYTLIDLSLIDQNKSVCAGGNLGSYGDFGWGEINAIAQNILGTETKTYQSQYQISIAFGVDINWSQNNITHRLVDMNGDGIPDLIENNPNGVTISSMSTSGLARQNTINAQVIQQSTTLNGGINVGFTIGFPVWMLKVGLGLNGSPVGLSATQVKHDMIDMNGDGLPDFVWCAEDGIHIRYNLSGKNGLLKTATNPTGHMVELDYELSDPTYERRGRQWLLSNVSDIDPHAHSIIGCDTIMYRFSYEDPHYDYAERQFLGYGTTVSYDINTDTLPHKDYRKVVRHYNNQNFMDHGKMIYESVVDANNNLFREYEIGTWYVDSTLTLTDNLCRDASVRVGTEVHYTRYYEGGEDRIVTAKKYIYDRYHNVREYINFGDTTLAEDDLRATIEYDSTETESHNLISLPSRMVVYNRGIAVREAQADYQNGMLSELRRNDLIYAQSDTSNYHYDSFGLPDSIFSPANQNGQRAFTAISYDQYSHTLPAIITDQWNRTMQISYDKFWKTPLTQTDPSGASFIYTYDTLGRLATISMPDDTTYQGTRKITIRYAYSPRNELNSNQYAYTRVNFPYREYIQRESYFDARGYGLCKKEKNIVFSEDQWIYITLWNYSDITAKDCFGRVKAQYRNFIDNRDSVTIFDNDSLHLFTQHQYDILDRPVSLRWQDGGQQTNVYSLGNDNFGIKRLQQISTDERGFISQIFNTPQGWITTTIQPGNIITSFTYDALGQLLSSFDPDGINVTHTYDGFGRKKERHHPDSGTTLWTYDNAGNLISSATQTQQNDGTQTLYEYDYNRVIAIRQPQHPQLDISYEYDTVGRISRISDITGYNCFEYDIRGHVSTTDRLLVIPSDTNAYKFNTQFKYDVFGRIEHIIYPDSERVRYSYEGENLVYMSGQNLNERAVHCYIDQLEYDAYRRPVKYVSGNRFHTDYTYNPNRLWLSALRTYNDQHLLQDLQYNYDPVGNITSIEQNADSVHWLGGAYMLEYQYDSLNRLVKADMISDYFGEYSDYTMTYSPSGMVGIKSCDDMLWNYWHGYCSTNNSITNHQVRSIYDMDNDATTFMMWDAAGRLQEIYRPCTGNLRHHWWNEYGQLAAVVDNGHCAFYGYDGDGERAYKLTGVTSIDQHNAGQETFHMNFDDAVMYVNPYFVVTPRGYTKHYYNGHQRIAAQIGQLDYLPDDIIDTSAVARERINNARSYMQSLFTQDIALEPDTTSTFVDIDGDAYDELQWQCVDDSLVWHITMHCDSNILLPVLAKDHPNSDNRVSGIYFYHPDHLGSATWITHGNKAVQFIHYMPFGEMWYNQQESAYNERFKFTGKERDTETGYDYFGARYYLPDLPIWLSPDPLADKYPYISPYAYCGWNPIKFVDPDGRTYVISTNGKVEKIDDGKDNQVILNANSTANQVTITLTKGKVIGLCPDENKPNINLLKMENLDVANELYDEMGKNMDMLEFNVVSAHSGDENFYYVGDTQGSKNSSIGSYVFVDLGQTIDYMKHFHPTNPEVSTHDKKNAANIYRNKKQYPHANPNVKLYVTHRDKEGELHDEEY